MTTNPDNNNGQFPINNNGQPPQAPAADNGYGQAIHPQALADAKRAKSYGIWAIVLAAVSLLIFGFLSLPALFLSIQGGNLAKKAGSAGVTQNPGKTLNLIGLILSIIAVVLWVLNIFLRVSGTV